MKGRAPGTITCRLCVTLLPSHATMCTAYETTTPWIPDEPRMDPRLIRFAVWGGGVVLVALPGSASAARESR